jgi:hypothetical protein
MQIWYILHAVSIVSRKRVRSATFEKIEAYMMLSVHTLQRTLDMWPGRASVTAVLCFVVYMTMKILLDQSMVSLKGFKAKI